MATINAPSLQDTLYSGDCPLAPAHGYVTLATAAIADKVRLNKLFAGTKVYAAHFVNAALGASTTVKLGFEYANGEAGSDDDAFIAATATNAAGRVNSVAAPITLEYDAYVIATIGGATANGKLDTVLTYEFKGK